MDKIEKIRKEIEGRKGYISVTHFAEELLSFLDTLKEEPDKSLEEARREYDTQKYTPSPSVGIEDVARVQFASHAKVFDKKRKAVFDWEQFKEVAGIFYGFGKKDSPETKEKEEPDMGLEEAAIDFADNARKELFTKDYAISSIADYDHGCIDGFIAGAQWQAEQNGRDVIFWKGMRYAYDRMKEDAVEGMITCNNLNRYILVQNLDDSLTYGDKVRIIIVKDK